MRRVVPVLLLVSLLTLPSCAREPLKQAGIQGENAISLVRDLASAYERKNSEAFMEKVSPAFPDRGGFQKSVENTFAAYQTIRQKVQYNRMIITVQDKGNIKMTFTWEGEWQTLGGKVIRDGARSTLIVDKGAFKLLGVEGKNPYLPVDNPAPVRQ